MRLGFAILSSALMLGAIPSAHGASPAIESAENSIQLGLTGGFANYEENVRPQDTEEGALLGFRFGISALAPILPRRLGWSDVYVNAGYDFSAGFLTYLGNLRNVGQTPYAARDDSYFNSAVVRLGLGRSIGPNIEIIPFVAFGYQNWYRNVTGTAGFDEYYQAGLIGGGLKFDLATTSSLVVSAAAEGFAVLGGSVSVPSQNFLGDFGTSAEERVALDADYRLTDSWHAFAGLGVSHYGYSGSKLSAGGLYEPLSTTLQINSMFGLAYGF